MVDKSEQVRWRQHGQVLSCPGSFRTTFGRAYQALLAELATGAAGTIIPDGPRGPREVLKPGVLQLAQAAKVPILPLAAAARPAMRFSSWDRLVLPLPGSRGWIVYGAPVTVDPKLSPEGIDHLRVDLERKLTELQARADAIAAGQRESSVDATAGTGPA